MAQKAKTHSGARKRFKLLKSGLIKFARSGRRHLMTDKTSKRKRQLRGGGYIKKCDVKHLIAVL